MQHLDLADPVNMTATCDVCGELDVPIDSLASATCTICGGRWHAHKEKCGGQSAADKLTILATDKHFKGRLR